MTDAKQTQLVVTTTIVDRNAATVSGSFDGLEVTGSSKRAPEDEHLPEVGQDLALADLFEKLSVKLRKRAQGRVNTFENNRRQRRASAERKSDLVYFEQTERLQARAKRNGKVTASKEFKEAFEAALDEMRKVGWGRPFTS